MAAPTAAPRHDATTLIRYGVLALAAAGTVGAAYELAAERHWGSPLKMIPWVAVIALAVSVVTALSPAPRMVLVTRVLAAAVLGASLFGIAYHVLENLHAGHLDPAFGLGFKELPRLEQIWYAATKTVGEAPPLAPGMLGQSALLVALSTLGRRDVKGR
ncbi:MAG: hypothetical protein AB7J32_25940 [Pseudonocardia sp.]